MWMSPQKLEAILFSLIEPKVTLISQKIMKKLKYWFWSQSLCIICVLTQLLGLFSVLFSPSDWRVLLPSEAACPA